MECGVAQRCEERRVNIPYAETYGGRHARYGYHGEVKPCDLRAEEVVRAAADGGVYDTEMHAGQRHGYDEDNLHCGRVEECHAQVLGAEAARAACRHGVRQSVEPPHSRQLESQCGYGGKPYIDGQHDTYDGLAAVMEVALCHRREFDVREHHLALAYGWKYHQCEHHYADTAHPACGHAPELQSLRQILHVVEDRGSCCGESRDALEPCVYYRELAAPHQVRECSDDARYDPCADDDAVSLLVGYVVAARHEDHGEAPH